MELIDRPEGIESTLPDDRLCSAREHCIQYHDWVHIGIISDTSPVSTSLERIVLLGLPLCSCAGPINHNLFFPIQDASLTAIDKPLNSECAVSKQVPDTCWIFSLAGGQPSGRGRRTQKQQTACLYPNQIAYTLLASGFLKC